MVRLGPVKLGRMGVVISIITVVPDDVLPAFPAKSVALALKTCEASVRPVSDFDH